MHTILVDLGARVMRYATIFPDGREMPGERLPTAAAKNLPDSLRQYAAKAGVPLEGSEIWISTLGPFDGERCIPLNLGEWAYTTDEVRAATGAARVEMLHDSLAYAWSIPDLDKSILRSAGNLTPTKGYSGGTAALIRMGVGLGVGALIDADGLLVPVSGEGGNATLAARTREEFQLVQSFSDHLAACGLEDRLGFSSAEAILSGDNLPAIHHAIQPGVRPPDEYEIVRNATEDRCEFCTQTMIRYAELLGTFAASVALTYDPPGGLFIFGQIPRVFDTRMTNAFRSRFNDRGVVSDYMAGYDVYFVDYEWAPFLGLRAALRGSIGWGQ